MWEASPDADKKCAVRSYLLTALEGSGDLSSNGESNLPQVSNLREVDIFL